MFVRIKGKGFDFFAGTKMRYYDVRADEFVDVRPGVRLVIGGWVVSNKWGVRRLKDVPVVVCPIK